MNLLTKKYIIETALTQEEILRRIFENTEIRQGDYYNYSYSNVTKLQAGKMPEDKFDLKNIRFTEGDLESGFFLLFQLTSFPGINQLK